MKKTALLAVILAGMFSGVTFTQGQGPDRPLPPEGRRPEGPRDGVPPRPPGGPEGQRPPGGPDRPQRPFVEQMRRHFQGQVPLEEMSSDERMRLRKAMEQVWNAEDVKTAREEAFDATRKYREALRAAVLKADPEIRPLLSRIIAERDRQGGLAQPGGDRPLQGGDQPRGEGQRRPLARDGEGRPRDGDQPKEGGGDKPKTDQPKTDQPKTDQPQGDGQRRPMVRDGEGRPRERDGEGRPRDGEGGPRPGEPAGEGARRPGAGLGLPIVDPEQAQNLTEEQRKQVRELMPKLEARAEIQEARKAVADAEGPAKREAFQKLRRVVRAALTELAPDFAKSLGELREGPPPGQRGEGEGREGRPLRPRGGGGGAGEPPAEGEQAPAPPKRDPNAPVPPGAPQDAPPKNVDIQ